MEHQWGALISADTSFKCPGVGGAFHDLAMGVDQKEPRVLG